MSTYKHGVYVNEIATRLVAPIEGTAGLIVAFGTAPVNLLADPSKAVNKPLLVHNFKEAVEAIGWSDDFASYTLCEAVSAAFQVVGVGPMILINVLDPSTHKTAVAETTVAITDHVGVMNVKGVLNDSSLSVKNGTTALTKDTDYTVSFNDAGNLVITLLSTGTAYSAASLKVEGYKIDPSAVTAASIVGGVDNSGNETGLEVIRQIYPRFGMTPGILIAPRYSMEATVAAALQAKCRAINSVFRCVTMIDINCKSGGALLYSNVKTVKESQAVSSADAYALWPFAKVGTTVYSSSSLAAAHTAYNDAANADTPNASPSNLTVPISAACLADGTEVILDLDQANTINSFGVATWLNMNGFRLWGNNTAAYPGTTDPKDRWFSARRFLSWAANTFILTYWQKVDRPANPRLIEAVVDSENLRGAGFVNRGICARYAIEYLAEENQTTDLLNGKLTFHQYITPYLPAEDIEDLIEFDPDALAAALAA